jgi:hypothetical protein
MTHHPDHAPLPRTQALASTWLALLLAACLAGCANAPDTGAPFMRPAAHVAFEKQHLALAKRHAAEDDLAQAAFHWEVLAVLRPDVPGHAAQLAQTRAQIDKRAEDLLRSARQAQQKGAWDEATQRYLSVLALAPEDAATTQAASQALRAIERERVRREQLGKYTSRQLQPRMPLAVPRKPAATAMPAPAPAPSATPAISKP